MYESSTKLILVGYFVSVLIALPEIGVGIGRMKCTNSYASITVQLCRTRNIGIVVATFDIVGLITDVYIYSIATIRVRSLQVKTGKIQLTVGFALGTLCVDFKRVQFASFDEK